MDFETLAKMSQKELKAVLAKHLAECGYPVKANKGYVYAKGKVPVLLVAHLDTVHKQRIKSIYYNQDRTRLMSPEGIGGDDRAGVFIILQVIKNYRCHVLFCEDEEIGAIGARAFTKSKIKPAVNYIVEVDRRGANDAVFYRCDNPDFTDFVCAFGFKKEFGSFSDISVIAPHLGIAAVNLSAGYHNEHTKSEFVDLLEMEATIERIMRMVETPSEKFDFIERHLFSRYSNYGEYGQQVLDLWGHMGREQETGTKEELMPLPDSAYLIINGHPKDGNESYMMDARGNVYDYVPSLDVAVKLENTAAYSLEGSPVRFAKCDAVRTKVLPLETAVELLNCG